MRRIIGARSSSACVRYHHSVATTSRCCWGFEVTTAHQQRPCPTVGTAQAVHGNYCHTTEGNRPRGFGVGQDLTASDPTIYCFWAPQQSAEGRHAETGPWLDFRYRRESLVVPDRLIFLDTGRGDGSMRDIEVFRPRAERYS